MSVCFLEVVHCYHVLGNLKGLSCQCVPEDGETSFHSCLNQLLHLYSIALMLFNKLLNRVILHFYSKT